MAAPLITLPDSPQLTAAHRRIDAVRDRSGRVATGAGALAAVVGMVAPGSVVYSLPATVVATGAGLATLWLGQPAGHQRATTTVLYLIPGVGLAGVLAAECLVAGIHWGEALAVLVWSAFTGLMRPARIARRMVHPAPPAPAPAPAVQLLDSHPAAAWWAQNVAVDKGAAPATLLEGIERTGESALRATIRAAVPGEPVPDVSIKRLSALMDVPEDLISITPVPGRGAGVRRLTIGATEETETDPTTVWEQRIAPAAMPGAVLTGIRVGTLTSQAAPAVDLTKETR